MAHVGRDGGLPVRRRAALDAVGEHLDVAITAAEDLHVAVEAAAGHAGHDHQPVGDLGRQRHLARGAIALVTQRHCAAAVERAQPFPCLREPGLAIHGIDAAPVDAGDAVAGLEARRRRRAVRRHPGDAHARLVVRREQHADHRLAQHPLLDAHRGAGGVVLAREFRIPLRGLVERRAGGIQFLLLRRRGRGLRGSAGGKGEAQRGGEERTGHGGLHAGLLAMEGCGINRW